jgi:hypothetical protein
LSADTPLERAKARVVEARARVFVQEQRLMEIRRDGRNATSAEFTLGALQRALRIFEAEYEAELLRPQKHRT